MASEPVQAPVKIDPDLTETWQNSYEVVEVDDVCTVKKPYLTTSKLTITWMHRLFKLSEDYYQLAAINTSRENAKFYFFVAESKIPSFKALNTTTESDDVITFKVTKDFRYGQNEEKSKDSKDKKVPLNRFLVYQVNDSSHDVIFQRRFAAASWEKWRNMLAESMKGVPTVEEGYAFLGKSLDKYIGGKLERFK